MPSIKPTVRAPFDLNNEKSIIFPMTMQSYDIFIFFLILLCIILQALRFYGSFNVTVTGITIQNSPQCHLKFDNCMGVVVHDITVSSPGDSPNTDGIHLQNSKDVLIHGSSLACGK